jgi:hypothetical protein
VSRIGWCPVPGDIELDSVEIPADRGKHRAKADLLPWTYRIVKDSPDLRFNTVSERLSDFS